MTSEEMKKRTKAFALRVVRLAESFPRSRVANHVAGQMIRSGTSVPANYRAACRARSRADFVSKLGIVEEEADETLFWIEFSVNAGLVKDALVTGLTAEGDEILSIVVTSIKTARSRAQARAESNPQSAIRIPTS